MSHKAFFYINVILCWYGDSESIYDYGDELKRDTPVSMWKGNVIGLAGKKEVWDIMTDKFQIFWNVMELCDWSSEGNDEKVLRPVIEYLSKQSDDFIFKFDDLMSELLYDLDSKKLASQCKKIDSFMSDDSFLYSRCVALINGPEYYEKVKGGNEESLWNMEFEALLYVPGDAWALKHKSSSEEYPHFSPLDYETGSNIEGWK